MTERFIKAIKIAKSQGKILKHGQFVYSISEFGEVQRARAALHKLTFISNSGWQYGAWEYLKNGYWVAYNPDTDRFENIRKAR